jgi:7,8-dihydroneopterin aldolase/epimerase/oxygenase
MQKLAKPLTQGTALIVSQLRRKRANTKMRQHLSLEGLLDSIVRHELSMDCIRVNGVRAYGYIGALPEEQVLGQWFEVDLALWLDLTLPGQSDRLADTFNYATAAIAVQTLIQTARFALLERLASAIADTLLQLPSPSPIQQVHVRLTKLTPPIPNFSGTVAVEITRCSSQQPAVSGQ